MQRDICLDYKAIGKRMKELLEKSDIPTQLQLAETTGINTASICKILKGDIEGCRLETIANIADALGTSIDYLVYGDTKSK